MQVTVLFFAIVREMVGASSIEQTLSDGSTVDDLFTSLVDEHPGLSRLKPSLLFMVNQEYARQDVVLNDGDEVALIPPVSGGAEKRFWVTTDPIDANSVIPLVETTGSGAIATFLGNVRDTARGRSVTLLEYEAYPPAAERMLEQIGEEIRERWNVDGVAIAHRFGRLTVGETSVVIAVSSAHRGDAFEACRYAIDRIKEIVPIWKKEFYEDGETWIGSESDYQAAFGRSGKKHTAD